MHTNLKLLLFASQGLLLRFFCCDFFFLSSSCCIFPVFLPIFSPVCGFQIPSISLFSPSFAMSFLSHFSFCGCQREGKLQPANPNCSNTLQQPQSGRILLQPVHVWNLETVPWGLLEGDATISTLDAHSGCCGSEKGQLRPAQLLLSGQTASPSPKPLGKICALSVKACFYRSQW